jgi:hypothetical protein
MPLSSTLGGHFLPKPVTPWALCIFAILIKCNFTKFIPSHVIFGLFGEKEVAASIS